MIQKINRPASIQRKRRVYRVLMVIIGLAMIADLVNLFLSPARDFSNFDPSSMPSLDENAQLPEGFNPSQGQFPQGQMPEGMTPPSGEAPEGLTPPSGQAPEGMTPPSGEMPEGFTPPQDGNASRPDAGNFNPQRAGGPAGGLMGLSLMARRAWLPILIVCLLLEAFCLYRLTQLKKQAALEAAKDVHQGPPSGAGPLMGDPKTDKSKGADAPDLQNYLEDPDDPDDYIQKKTKVLKKSDRILPLLLVLAVSAVIASLPSDQSKANDATTNEKVLSTTAQAQTITSLLSGTGTLQDQKAQGVTVPEEVTLEAYHVNNGDLVSQGDLLATVNRASVGLAIEDLQAVIDELDQDLKEAQDQSPSTKIKAAADGRVKAIYAEEGQSVLKTISDDQSLMIISLDGLMAVDLETDQDLATGEEIEVVLSDGSQKEGQVSAKEEGKVTVTLSDQSAPIEDPVTLYRADGQELGQGTLYVHSPLKVTGYYGTTDSLHVQVNDKVEKGDRLITLTHVGSSDTYQNLLKRRKQLEDQMEDLSKIYQEGGILAPGEGLVSGIPQGSKIISLSQEEGDTGDQVQETASWTQKEVSSAAVISFDGVQTSAVAESLEAEALLDPLTQPADPIPSQTELESTSEDPSEAPMETPSETETEQVSQGPSEPSTQAPSESSTEAQSEEETQTASLLHYPAKVVSVDASSVHFVLATTPIQGASHKNLTGWTEGNFDYSVNYTCSAALSVDLHQNGKWETIPASDLVPGELCLISFQKDGLEKQTPIWITAQRGGNQASASDNPQGEMTPQAPSSTAPMQAMGSAPSTGSTQKSPSLSASSQSTSETAESKIYESYSLEEKTVLSITAQEKMSLEVQIDELDILSLRQDMPVTITLEALKGQAFTGTLSQISASATNEGGNSKYKVTVTLPKSDNLIAGMNAAVKIQTDQKENVMSLPVSALMEDGEKTYVYTQYDEKKDALGEPVEVQTGLSDGELVEIQSGLEKDTPVYYRYADAILYKEASSN